MVMAEAPAGSARAAGRAGAAASLVLGVLGALFFSVSFIANRMMAVDGGAWEWSAALRYLFALPILLALVGARGGVRPVLAALRADPLPWTLWSTIGFGLFYAPLCLAADLAPGWTIAATWQVTIVCGLFLAPLLYDDERRRVPARGVALSGLVLAGVLLSQAGGAGGPSARMAGGVAAVLVAAVAYPVGNRRTMDLAGPRLGTFQRLLAMSIASLPCWLALALAGAARTGPPPAGQVATTLVVAVSSGVIATSLFFAATHRVRRHPLRLAAVEATQAVEVVFVALLEPLFTTTPLPGALAWTGIAAIVLGVVLYAFAGRPAPGG